ncbi:MAG: methylase, partial [Pseudomonadota bacterium]
ERLYGLSDHVRWYGRTDFKRRLAAAGFEVLELSKEDIAPPEQLARLSVECEQGVILVRKP